MVGAHRLDPADPHKQEYREDHPAGRQAPLAARPFWQLLHAPAARRKLQHQVKAHKPPR